MDLQLTRERLKLLELRHPGHPDQKVHGRRGSGTPAVKLIDPGEYVEAEKAAFLKRFRDLGATDEQLEGFVARRDFSEPALVARCGRTTVVVRDPGVDVGRSKALAEHVEGLRLRDPHPDGDVEIRVRRLEESEGGDNVGGFTWPGQPFMTLNRNVMVDRPMNGSLMPSGNTVPAWKYAATHEYGHMRDTRSHEQAARDHSRLARSPHWRSMSPYGRTNDRESYAEAYAEYVLTGGRTSNGAAQLFGGNEGWPWDGEDRSLELRHPGHPDQKVHAGGRRHSTSAVRAAVARAEEDGEPSVEIPGFGRLDARGARDALDDLDSGDALRLWQGDNGSGYVASVRAGAADLAGHGETGDPLYRPGSSSYARVVAAGLREQGRPVDGVLHRGVLLSSSDPVPSFAVGDSYRVPLASMTRSRPTADFFATGEGYDFDRAGHVGVVLNVRGARGVALADDDEGEHIAHGDFVVRRASRRRHREVDIVELDLEAVEDRSLELRHPGHPDQKVHAGGRRRTTTIDGETVEHLDAVAYQRELDAKTEADLVSQGFPPEMARGLAQTDPPLAVLRCGQATVEVRGQVPDGDAEGIASHLGDRMRRDPLPQGEVVAVLRPLDDSEGGDSTGGLSVPGGSMMVVNSRTLQRRAGQSYMDPGQGHLMPSNDGTPAWKYISTHEYGHLRDHRSSRDIAGTMLDMDDFRSGVSRYALTSDHEFYAEAYTEWTLTAGRTTTAPMPHYAEVYGWP